MRNYYASWYNKPQGNEIALKSVHFSSHGFFQFTSVETYLIVASQRVFLGQVVSLSEGSTEIRTIIRTTTASPSLLIHQDMPCVVGEYMPCGNDGIDAHVEKRWKTSAFLHKPYEAQLGLPPFLHNRFENSFMRDPCHLPGKFIRRSFQQSLGKPCSLSVNSNIPDRILRKLNPPFYHDGFTTLPQGLLLLFLIFRKRRRIFMRKIDDRVIIITNIIFMDRQLTIDSKLPL